MVSEACTSRLVHIYNALVQSLVTSCFDIKIWKSFVMGSFQYICSTSGLHRFLPSTLELAEVQIFTRNLDFLRDYDLSS